jgi:heme-binding uptake protein ChaN (Tiki superfamily)
MLPGRFAAVMIACAVTVASGAETNRDVEFLRTRARAPADYVVSKLADHRVVILGEAHRIRHDVELVLSLVPRLPAAGADTLAVEMFPASEQTRIDRLVSAERWDAAEAMAVMRAASWPYREYLEILHAAWAVNRAAPAAVRLHILALGPGDDWRDRLLPQGKTYEGFMADLVVAALADPHRRVVLYCGVHHAYTRYHQPETPRDRRVDRFMDRTGNILWREFGEDVFTIALHRPWQCRSGNAWGRCLPLDGRIDCAAASLGHAVGFDVAESPFAEAPIDPNVVYAMGYPSLRLVDMTDGYVWTAPIDAYRGVSLIPLSEFAPDAASLGYVAAHDPLSDTKGLSRLELERLWADEEKALGDVMASFGWKELAAWRSRCADPQRR